TVVARARANLRFMTFSCRRGFGFKGCGCHILNIGREVPGKGSNAILRCAARTLYSRQMPVKRVFRCFDLPSCAGTGETRRSPRGRAGEQIFWIWLEPGRPSERPMREPIVQRCKRPQMNF